MFSFLKKYFKPKSSVTPLKEKLVTNTEYKTEKKSIADILEDWKYFNVNLNEGASEDLITFTQIQLDFVFPMDFVNFHKKVNGFRDWDMVGEMFSIWPLERILEEYLKNDDKNFIPFCDFMINSHWIGYVKGKAGIFKSYDEFNSIAGSFEETIFLIEQKSDLLY